MMKTDQVWDKNDLEVCLIWCTTIYTHARNARFYLIVFFTKFVVSSVFRPDKFIILQFPALLRSGSNNKT